jgi:hypothetical protein
MTDQNNAAHDLGTSSGGRAYIAEYFATQLRRHDFATYINSTLAADFACALAQHLSKLRAEGVQAGDERERGYAENAAFRVWWDENQAFPEHSLTTENAAHAAWQERGRRAALASAPVANTMPIRLSPAVLEYLKEGIDNATGCEESDVDHDFANELSRLMTGPLYTEPLADYREVEWGPLVVAPVAGEARASQLEDPSKGGLIPEVRLRALALADTAPQASEAVRYAVKTCGRKVLNALAAIAMADGPDTRKADDPELIYRSPVMEEIVRIHQAYEELERILQTQADKDGQRNCRQVHGKPIGQNSSTGTSANSACSTPRTPRTTATGSAGKPE